MGALSQQFPFLLSFLRLLNLYSVTLVKKYVFTGQGQNVAELEWPQVDMQRNVAWVHANQGKARKSIHISLNTTAMKVLRK
ncbi:MAG: tyrosine-type recombinase/integrase [Nitrosomonas sp.]|nr:tyrosine-type recombinase/integrase [Nitrosomonas sp.]